MIQYPQKLLKTEKGRKYIDREMGGSCLPIRKFRGFAHKKEMWIVCGAALGAVLAITILCFAHAAPITYLVTNGNTQYLHTTHQTDPVSVLEELRIFIGPDDRVHVEGDDIRVQRACRVYLDCYGQAREIIAHGETVAELLTRRGLPEEPGDMVSAPETMQVYDGMHLRLTRVICQEQTYSAVIPHDTIVCTSDAIPRGTQRILRAGVDGELVSRASVTYVNGEETERTVLYDRVIRHPVQQIVAIGIGNAHAAEAVPVITESTIILPTGEVLTYDRVITSLSTAYCDKGRTATGTEARVGAIAVDPRYIPYGTRMFIMSVDGEYIYGIATAEDCGSLDHIVGTRTDLHFDTYEECRQFGARNCLIFFLS